ncbi:Putative acetyltransferase OS=Streptomyces albaduncus OX=68172 GN=FHS32_004058 PE=3 SV=1 [Streptomyces griseoloalbus]
MRSGYRAPDDLLPHVLPDPRAAAVTTQADFLWVRILDVVRAMEARTYGASGALVLEVADAGGLAGGRYRVEASADGAGTCAPTTENPHLSLDVADLATRGSGTSRRCGSRRWAGCGKNERAPPVRPTPCCVRPGDRGARTSSECCRCPVSAAVVPLPPSAGGRVGVLVHP